MVSIYIAKWSGLMHALTGGDISHIPTWTKDDMIQAFEAAGLAVYDPIISILMYSDVTVFDLKEALLVCDVDARYRYDVGCYLGINSGIREWCSDYLFGIIDRRDMMLSVDWVRVIRSNDRPLYWSDEEVDALLADLVFQNRDDLFMDFTPPSVNDHVFINFLDTTVRECDLHALVWAMETMTSQQRSRCSYHIEFAMATLCQDVYAYQPTIFVCTEMVSKLEWDREEIIEVFKYVVVHQSISDCIRDTVEGDASGLFDNESGIFEARRRDLFSDVIKTTNHASRATMMTTYFESRIIEDASTVQIGSFVSNLIENMKQKYYVYYYDYISGIHDHLPFLAKDVWR